MRMMRMAMLLGGLFGLGSTSAVQACGDYGRPRSHFPLVMRILENKPTLNLEAREKTDTTVQTETKTPSDKMA